MWTQGFIETTRGTFELFEKGSGPPMAITHLYSAFDSRGNHFANPFTDHYHVYLINLRGAGNSVQAKEESEYSMDESVLELEAIRIALNIDTWAFGGHSTGGMLALKYATLAQKSLDKIVAGGASASVAYSQDVESIYNQQNPNFKRIIEIMDLLNDVQTPIEIRQSISYEWTLMSYHKEENLKEALRTPNSGKTVEPRLDYFRKVECATYDIREELKSVYIPAYIYAGRFDTQCPYKYGEEIARLLPNSTFVSFNESNHFPYSEEAEKFHKFVIQTLD